MYQPQNPDSRAYAPPLAPRRAAIAPPQALTGLPARIEAVGWAVAWLSCAAYVLYIAQLTSLPFQDYPNHLVRGAVIADLLFHHGARFGEVFDFHLAPLPYILHDLLLAGCVELFGPVAAAGIFNTLVLLSLPGALLFYMHVNNLAPRARWLVFLLSLYLATDWFFLAGFTAFRLALALVVVSMALADMLRARWSAPRFAAYVAVLLLGYLTHLTAPVFFMIALLVSGLVRLPSGRTNLRLELCLLTPAAALLALHFGVLAESHGSAAPPAYTFEWGDRFQKLHGLLHEFERFDGRLAKPMMIALAACLLWPIRRELSWRALKRPAVVEQLALAGAFLGLYAILPRAYADAAFVDIRALSMLTLCLMFACLYLADESPSSRGFDSLPVLALASLLAVTNFAYLVIHLGKDNAAIVRYREVVASLPAGSYVLPVYTQPLYELSPLLHAGAYAVLERSAVSPSLFSRDRGDPMKYFSYRHRPYTPDEWWYLALQKWNDAVEATYTVEGQTYRWRFYFSRPQRQWVMMDLAPVDWNRIACEYDFLLVTVPFEPSHIRIPTRTTAANETAALLAVDKQACRPEVRQERRIRLPQEH